ncbi:AP-3 complex subunit delta [Impatiens glandulifera]|uniref:AP-3 complex subunit delta n=1 Tax=Impatiens glandulifera TaxID=253017 RepID=UPI001FB1416C|nr:AP-3 complex subunit delta [Impatiens glandulifera]
MAGPSIMDSLFQRSLDDLIKGLRLHVAGGVPAFISKALDEIRREIKSTDLQMKATALQKLTYLRSLHGIDDSWAAFHAVEVAASPRFHHKRIGYLAASQSFHAATDVALLLTNQIRKDLGSANEFEVSLALECLSVICTPDLARDLTPDIFTLLSSSKTLVRKKAISTVFRVFIEYPDAVRVCFKRLVDNLESSDVQTVSTVIGVFCELASRDPRSYLPMAPEFYKILVDCKNNWVLIKVLKIFGNLAPLEPRLANRIVEPICEHMKRTGAKSLLFECIKTVVTCLSDHESAVALAVSKIKEFLVDDDPNLKYLGLQALAVAAPRHLWAVEEHKDVMIKSLSDEDPNIKIEALRLVMAMVSEDNVVDISKVLISYALKSDPDFSNLILGSILSTCGRNYYEIVNDFDWYVSLLGEMARIPHCQKGEEIESQLIDIGMRVKDVRPELLRVGRDLLIDPALLGNTFLHSILSAAAWISGEYVEFSRNPMELLEALLQPRTNLLPPSTRSVYIQSVFKVLTFCLHFESKTIETDVLSNSEVNEEINTRVSILSMINCVKSGLVPLMGTHDVEVQERARNVLGFVDLVEEELETSEVLMLLHDAFSEELGPISLNTQLNVYVPDGITLKENLQDLDSIYGDISSFSIGKPLSSEMNSHNNNSISESEPSTESTSLLAEHRKKHGLFYLAQEKNDTASTDYPPANESKLVDDREDLMKLATQSLGQKRKPIQVKPRPFVVKLDGDETATVASSERGEAKNDLVSDAVRDVLLGHEASSTSSRGQMSIKSKNRSHGKERQQKKGEESTNVNGRRKNRNKTRKKADGSVSVAAQTGVIPDFLL